MSLAVQVLDAILTPDLKALGRKCHKALDIMRSLSPLSILPVLSISVDVF